jgi:hypothetical protein
MCGEEKNALTRRLKRDIRRDAQSDEANRHNAAHFYDWADGVGYDDGHSNLHE